MGYYRRLPIGPDALATGLSQQFLYDPAETGRSSFCGRQSAACELLSADDDAWDDHDLLRADSRVKRDFCQFPDSLTGGRQGYGFAVHKYVVVLEFFCRQCHYAGLVFCTGGAFGGRLDGLCAVERAA